MPPPEYAAYDWDEARQSVQLRRRAPARGRPVPRIALGLGATAIAGLAISIAWKQMRRESA